MNPFHYAMRSRQIQLEKQKERDARNQQANTQRMNVQTDSTGLYGANQNDANARITRDVAKTLVRNREIENAKKEFESEIVKLHKDT